MGVQGRTLSHSALIPKCVHQGWEKVRDRADRVEEIVCYHETLRAYQSRDRPSCTAAHPGPRIFQSGNECFTLGRPLLDLISDLQTFDSELSLRLG